jgi:hypothetical protein
MHVSYHFVPEQVVLLGATITLLIIGVAVGFLAKMGASSAGNLVRKAGRGPTKAWQPGTNVTVLKKYFRKQFWPFYKKCCKFVQNIGFKENANLLTNIGEYRQKL